MATQEIPRDQWKDFCDTFSQIHQGWLADVQVTGAGQNRHFEAKGLPFRGVTYETKGTGKDEVSIFMDQSPKENLTHTIGAPSHIRLQQADNGIDQGIEVDAKDGTKAIVRFQHPMSPDAVDLM